MQPDAASDLHDGIDCEIQEFALAQAGAGEELHAQADERVVVGAGGLQQSVNAASSRKRGNGSSRSGRSPENMSTRAGMSSPSHSVSRSKQVRRVPRCSARPVLDNRPPPAAPVHTGATASQASSRLRCEFVGVQLVAEQDQHLRPVVDRLPGHPGSEHVQRIEPDFGVDLLIVGLGISARSEDRP